KQRSPRKNTNVAVRSTTRSSLALDTGDCDHRRLVQDDTAPFHVDDGVCRAEVDRHFGRQQTQHSSKHLTANPIEKRSIGPRYPMAGRHLLWLAEQEGFELSVPIEQTG